MKILLSTIFIALALAGHAQCPQEQCSTCANDTTCKSILTLPNGGGVAECHGQLRRGEACDGAKPWLTQATLEFRADWQGTWQGSDRDDNGTGFRGQFLNVKLGGNLGRQWNWAYRQRLSKDMLRAGGYLNATDYLYLQYHPTERWSITAGKQFVAIGGFEYDYAPIDVYKYSAFCNEVYCYGFGLSAAYDLTPHDNILVQAAQSAFAAGALNRYSYNIKWTGTHGIYQSLYSIGMQEYASGKYINIIALGNRFDLGRVQVVADYTNRYANVSGAHFLSDFTAVGQVFAQPVKELSIFAHYSYDHNDGNTGDTLVKNGTKLHTFGLGAEYFPHCGKKDIRLHAAYYHTNTKENFLSIGLTFRPDLLNIKRQFKK